MIEVCRAGDQSLLGTMSPVRVDGASHILLSRADGKDSPLQVSKAKQRL